MSSKLRIAFFVGCFPVVSETFILRQITGLIDLGHEVEIFADTRPAADPPLHPEVEKYCLLERTTYMDLPPETAPWEMPVWPITGRTWLPGAERPVRNFMRVARAVPKFLRCLTSSPHLALSVMKPSEYGYQATSLSALHRLARLSSSSRGFDVLHAHFGSVGNSFRFARALLLAPLVVSFHGFDFSTLPRKEGAGMYRRLFETADAITVNSDYTRERVEQLGCPPAKLRKMPVGLNPDEFTFRERVPDSDKPVRLLTVGRLVEIKGHALAIRAVATLRVRHPDIRYDIVGDGPLRPELEKLIGVLDVREIVTLHGARDGRAVKRLMANAHLFMLASVNVEGDAEGQGLVLQEAQACGLPVVATEHGAFPEGILAGKSGFLVPERNVDALTNRLNFLIEHSETWPAMGRHGRKFVEERYDIRHLNRELAGIYTEAIEKFPGRKA